MTMTMMTPKVVGWWLVLCNICVAASWLKVFTLIVTYLLSEQQQLADSNANDADAETGVEMEDNSFCELQIRPAVYTALMTSFIEVVNSLLGFTKSPLPAVLLFSCTRFGVEQFIGPKVPCTCWQHLLTVACWSLGDTVRFSSLAIVTLAASTTTTTTTSNTTTGENTTGSSSSSSTKNSSSSTPSLTERISYVAKSIRFTVGPVLFPIGASGEMFMVILAGTSTGSSNNMLWYYGAAALWPVFFYPMMVQLLKQRRRHFSSSGTKPKKKQIKMV